MPSEPGYHTFTSPPEKIKRSENRRFRKHTTRKGKKLRAHKPLHMHRTFFFLLYQTPETPSERVKRNFSFLLPSFSCPICVENVSEEQTMAKKFSFCSPPFSFWRHNDDDDEEEHETDQGGERVESPFVALFLLGKQSAYPVSDQSKTNCPVLLNPVPFFIKIKKKFIRTHGGALEL